MLHVPLLLQTPRQGAGRRETALHSQTEVRGLLLEALGIAPAPPPAPCAEADAVPAAIVGYGPPDALHSKFRTVTAVGRDWQLLRSTERTTGRVTREEFVPRTAGAGGDPAAEVTAHLRTIAECIDRTMRGRPHQAPAAPPTVGAAERARLQALGYVAE